MTLSGYRDHRRTGAFELGGGGGGAETLPEKSKQCPNARVMSVEIGMQTHSNCVKDKNVPKLTACILNNLEKNLKLIKRKSSSFHGVRSAIGRSATETFVFQDASFGRPLRKLSHIKRLSR